MTEFVMAGAQTWPVDHGWTGTQPIVRRGAWMVSGVDSGLRHLSQKGPQMGGRTLPGTQPSFHIWYTHGLTGLRPYPPLSGGLVAHYARNYVYLCKLCGGACFEFEFFFPTKYLHA